MSTDKKTTLSDRISQTEEPARLQEALDLLRSRGALKDDRCPSCGTDNWNVDFLAIPSVPLPVKVPPNTVFHVGIGGPSSYIPTLTLVCMNCGYMKLHNLNLLGLGGK